MTHISEGNGVLDINHVLIRPAESRDVDRIYRLIDFNKLDEHGNGRVLPLTHSEINGVLDRFVVADLYAVVGCGSVVDYEYEGEPIAELRSLVVDETFRGQGIGRRLLDYGKQLAQGLGYNELHALVKKTEPRLAAFFERNGFEFVEGRPIAKVQRDCVGCPLYNNGCNEATYAAKLSPSGLLVPGSYHSSQNGSAYSGRLETRAVP